VISCSASRGIAAIAPPHGPEPERAAENRARVGIRVDAMQARPRWAIRRGSNPTPVLSIKARRAAHMASPRRREIPDPAGSEARGAPDGRRSEFPSPRPDRSSSAMVVCNGSKARANPRQQAMPSPRTRRRARLGPPARRHPQRSFLPARARVVSPQPPSLRHACDGSPWARERLARPGHGRRWTRWQTHPGHGR
jgi:hypothetical protein